MIRRIGLVSALVALGLAASAAPATASVTLGSALATEPNGTTSCSATGSSRGCLAVDTFLPGREVVAPSTGQITSWHVRLGSGTQAQSIRLRILRQTSATEFQILSSGPLEDIPAGAGTYAFTSQLPIAPGDQVGLEAGSGTDIEWRAPLPGAQSSEYGALPDNQFTTGPPTFTNPDFEHTFNVVLDPTNTFTVGTVTRNKKKGTATIAINDITNPGELTGSGKSAKVSSARAVSSKSVGAGSAQLVIKAKGKKRKKLNQKGKVKLSVAVTYTPTGGDPNTQSVKVKLKKKL